MKILVMNWQDPRNPLAGGAEVQFREVFSRIAAAGHSVTLVCSGFDGAPREEMLDGIRVVRQECETTGPARLPGCCREKLWNYLG